MEKQEYSQLELFHKPGDEGLITQRLSGTFLSYIRTYEHLVLMFIGIVITGVVCFCVGVEKGKHIAFFQVKTNYDIARGVNIMPYKSVVSVAPTPKVTSPSVVAVAQEPVLVAKTISPLSGGGYTIQIASYTGMAAAQQEISALKKLGLLPVLKSSGKYTVLCVGNFPDQAKAKSVLTQLKRKYGDCYIRRL